MSLPIVTLKNDERWTCHQCGFCCRGSVIPLSADDVQRLRSQKWEELPEYRKSRILVHNFGSLNSYRLAHRADGSCIFLAEDGLCRIHTRFGMDAKPVVCQTFPLQLIPQDKQAVLTVRRSCPSAGADLGIPSAKQLPFIKELVRDNRLKAEPTLPPRLKSGDTRNWSTTRLVLEAVGTILQDQRFPPVRRLVHALQFAHLLERAQTRRLSDEQIIELAQTLAELAPDESSPFFDDRAPPKKYSRMLFHLVSVNIARLLPACRHESKLSTRYQLLKIACRILIGKGPAPNIDRIFPVVDLCELDKPHGAWPTEVYLPLTRFIETNSASFMYAIADRHAWSIVDSIRGLAVLFPVGLWLLRWLAHGREPTFEDMVHIVVALDRSQGFAPLSGSLHRRRLSTLSANGELERTVVWYAS